MTAKDLEDTLAAIATKAKALRDAGVVGPVTIGDISFELARSEAPAPAYRRCRVSKVRRSSMSNLLDDPEPPTAATSRAGVFATSAPPDDNQE
jgi:hypothetical protein